MNSEMVNTLVFFNPTEDLKLCSGPPKTGTSTGHGDQHPPKMSSELWWLEMTT